MLYANPPYSRRSVGTMVLLMLSAASSTAVDTGVFGEGAGYTVRDKVMVGSLAGKENFKGDDLTWVVEDLWTGRDVGIDIEAFSYTVGGENMVEGVTPLVELYLVSECLCVSCGDGLCVGESDVFTVLPVNTKSHFYAGRGDAARIFKFSIVLRVSNVLVITDPGTVEVAYRIRTSREAGCLTESGKQCSFPFILNGVEYNACTDEAVPECYTFEGDGVEPCWFCDGAPSNSSTPAVPHGGVGVGDVPVETETPSTPSPGTKDLETASLTFRVLGGVGIIFLGCCIGCGSLLWLANRHGHSEREDTSSHHSPVDGEPRDRYTTNHLFTSPSTFDPNEIRVTVQSLIDLIPTTQDIPPTVSCPVCLETGQTGDVTVSVSDPYEEGTAPDDAPWAVLPCKHDIHVSCLKQWLTQRLTKKQQMTCPVCRASLSEEVGAQIGGDAGGVA